jgi:hypothetical protein
LAARKSSNASHKGGGQFYVVGPRGSGAGGREAVTFRDSSSGQFTTRVMSNDAFRSASGKANTVIKEVLKNPPKVQPQKKK